MKVTIFGLAGTGKTSVAEAVASDLGWEFMSNGNLFRELARGQGMAISEFDKLVENRQEIDRKVDEQTAEYGRTHDNFIYEARLAWYFIPDSVKIKLDCGDDERIRRVAERDNISLQEARKQTLDREKTYRPRYESLYGIRDFSSDEHFDFILDTTPIDLPTVIANVKAYITTHSQYHSGTTE